MRCFFVEHTENIYVIVKFVVCFDYGIDSDDMILCVTQQETIVAQIEIN